ncbi:MAG: histidinol-phosphate transaminase [Chloroflexota bacterium]|nr:histidinol-phosphate transaminase [Chloroflexota bacterium]
MSETALRARDWIGNRVEGLKEYAPDPPEQIAKRLGMPVGQLIKLDANENPYGPTSHTRDVLRSYNHYHRYPDPLSRTLRRAIADYIGVPAETILVGNGSDELIDLILRLFRPDGVGGGVDQVIDCPPTFGMYQFYGTTNDMEVLLFPRDGDFHVDVEGIAGLCDEDPQPRILFVTSPNNPDGQVLPEGDLERLLDLPLLIVLDEAYVEFSGNSKVGWVQDRENLIVLRTFSKWAGLAGLRVGYGVFPEGLMHALWRLKSPYNVNGVAQAAALATLEEIDQARDRVDAIVAERQKLSEKLQQISFLHVYESQANYILCRVEGVPVQTIREAMEERGIILRYYNKSRLRDHIRISVGTPMQDEAVVVALRGLDEGGGKR